MTVLGNKISRQQIDEALLVAVSSSVFLPIGLSSLIIILAALNFLFDRNLNIKLQQLLTNKLALLVMGLFVIQIFSALISQNSHEAFLVVERRLSFLLFPLLLLGHSSGSTIKKVSLSFVFACQVSILICLGGAFVLFIHSNDWGVFFYHNLSSILGLNAIYLSIYCSFSLFVLLYYYKNFSIVERRISLVSMVFLMFGLVLLSSKMLLFGTLIGVVLFLVWKLRSRYHKGLIFSGAMIFCSLVLILKPVRQRFQIEFNSNTEVLKLNQYRYDTPFTGLTLRLVIWKFCYEIINEKRAWISGVGVGDFQDLLNQKYTERGLYIGNKQLGDTGYIGYGPHNQWVETFISMGLLGLLYFIFLVSFVFNHYKKQGNVLSILFFMIFIMVSFTECVLSTNKGIVFFAFFICLFNGYNCRTISSNDRNE